MKEQNNNKSKYYNNLTKDERTTLKELADRNDIIITKADADEGRAVVILDVKDYVKENQHQLNNRDAYKKLGPNTTICNRHNNTFQK